MRVGVDRYAAIDLEAGKQGSSMSTYVLLALTIGIAVTVTSAFLITGGSSASSTSTSSTATSSSTSSASTATVSDQGLGIELVLSVSPGQGPYATSFEVNATVWNTLSRPNNVTGVDNYHGVQLNPLCNTGPVTFEVLKGYYTVANFTSGTVLSIHGVQNMMCVVPTSALSYYVFQPNSDVFTGPLADQAMGGKASTATMTTRSAAAAASLVNIYSSGLANPEPFPPGTYTVVAADNWGQLALVHFAVTG
jgi:hypothetical protein